MRHDFGTSNNNPVILGPPVLVCQMYVSFMCIFVSDGDNEKAKCPRKHIYMKFSLCFGPQTTYIKYAHLLQGHSVSVSANIKKMIVHSGTFSYRVYTEEQNFLKRVTVCRLVSVCV